MEKNIKTNEYFQNKMDSERKRIDKFESALNNLESSNIKGIRMGKIHLANLYLNCIKLSYSKDKSFQNMFPDYMKFLEYYKEVCTSKDSMYDIIDILSIGVLLQNRKNEFIGYLDEIVLKYDSNDGMITFFMDYLKNRTSQRTTSRIDYFNVLLKSEDKVKILKEELELWYDKHGDAYWYNSHESKSNTYCGYWCFEIAALVQIFDIDDTSLRENQYYPYEMKQIKKGFEMEQELVGKYEALLPSELIEIWKNYGFAYLLDGYLRVINPEDYQALLNETYFRGKISIPILTTAFGDVITLEEGQYIGMVKYKNGKFVILAKNFKRFLQNLADDYFLEKYFQIPQFVEAVKRLGWIEHDECFGYVPLLGSGGSEEVNNLSKVKIKEHIEIITQMVGKIGM